MRKKIVALALGLFGGLLGPGQLMAAAQSSATWTTTGSTGIQYMARAGDFNGDGLTDIASPFGGSNVRMHITGAGGFTGQTWTISTFISWPTSGSEQLRVGDFNCDGRADFMMFGSGILSSQILILENNGPGAQSFTATYYTVASGGWTVPSIDHHRTRIGNIDVPIVGLPDCSEIFIVHSGGSQVTILQKAFGPNFNIVANAIPINSSWGPSDGSFLGDFDCDGKVDDFASFNGGNVYMKFYGSGAFTSATQSNPGSNWGWGGYAETGKFTTSNPAFPPDCYWDVAIPVGGSILVKQNNGGSWSNVSWAVANSWNSPEWTFAGNFGGPSGTADFASVAGGPNVYMKFGP